MQRSTSSPFDQHIIGADDAAVSPAASLEALHQQLRTIRHGINNNVAVIMAMAELSQRNPAQSAKLSQLCLEKAPAIASAMANFSELFENLVRSQQNEAR